MKKSDAKKGAKIIYLGKERIINEHPRKGPFIHWKGGKKWQWEKWDLVKETTLSKPTTSRKKPTSSTAQQAKPVLHLVWKKHSSNEKFTKHFKKLEENNVEKEKMMSSQGWYCLGSKNNIGYIGLVGQVSKGGAQSKNTFRNRWNKEHDGESNGKFPKGFFKSNKIKIKNSSTHLYTASIVAARTNSKSKTKWKPRLLQRGPTQAIMIKKIEEFIIYYSSKWHKDIPNKEETKKFYLRSGNGWKNGKSNPEPYKFSSTKTMVNFERVENPPSEMILSSEFNIVFSGDMPKDLKEIFSKGVYVKDVLDPKNK